MVRALSDGFDDEAWVTQIAKPFIRIYAAKSSGRSRIATLSGTTMLVRESTDHSTPLAIERYSAGFRAPLLTTASGRVYLAHLHRRRSATRSSRFWRARTRKRTGPRGHRAELLRMLARDQGGGIRDRHRARAAWSRRSA